MDEPDGRRDNEGNRPKEVVGCGSGGIRHEEVPVRCQWR